jgi:hypothetical protein
MITFTRTTALLLLAALASPGCGGSGADDDGGSGTGFETDEDGGTDMDGGEDASLDGGADADGDADGDSDTGTGTDTGTEADTKGHGESCLVNDECIGDAMCLSGQYTQPYCSPVCATDDDCRDKATGECGTCQAAGQYKLCIYWCQIGGPIVGCGFTAVCPGDLPCDGAACG